MLVHLLDQRNLIRLADRVCEYIPEFASAPSSDHDSPRADPPRPDAELPREALRPRPPGTIPKRSSGCCGPEADVAPRPPLAYHRSAAASSSASYRRVTGKTIRAVARRGDPPAARAPLARLRVRPQDVDRVAQNYLTGPPALPPLSRRFCAALGIGFAECPRCRTTALPDRIIPSANVVATANELGLFYQLLLDGGELDGSGSSTRGRFAVHLKQSYLEFDLTLGLPVRYAWASCSAGVVQPVRAGHALCVATSVSRNIVVGRSRAAGGGHVDDQRQAARLSRAVSSLRRAPQIGLACDKARPTPRRLLRRRVVSARDK